MKPGELELTREQRQLAFRQLWRQGWPDNLEQAELDPVRKGCIHGLARQMTRQSPCASPTGRAPQPPAPATPGAPPGRKPYIPRSRNDFDARRAAANDLFD